MGERFVVEMMVGGEDILSGGDVADTFIGGDVYSKKVM